MKPNGNSPVSRRGLVSNQVGCRFLDTGRKTTKRYAYKGGNERFMAHGQEFPIGIIVNNRELRSGACKVDCGVQEASRPAILPAASFWAFRSQERYYLQVQLGAGQAAYCVSEFVSGFGWRPLKSAGPRECAASQPEVRRWIVSLHGQELRVSVDGIQGFGGSDSSTARRKTGRPDRCGHHEIRFSNFDVAADRPRAFVAMEYREPFDTFYREVIKPQAEKRYDLVRMDEKAGAGMIFQDMQREIAQSDIVIAEITPANPNVFYELGYAQALGKPTILLAQRGGNTAVRYQEFSGCLLRRHDWRQDAR